MVILERSAHLTTPISCASLTQGLRVILCKHEASYIRTVQSSNSDFVKLADSVNGHVKTRNQVLDHSIQPPLS